jgi:hypothetical protein
MKRSFQKLSLAVVCAVAGTVTIHTLFAQSSSAYTVHEWGTFTSVQGGDGELLSWRPLQSSDLPAFVHNSTTPAMNRYLLIPGKGGLSTLQRMETPVIYFYSDRALTVDVSVTFPKGWITEWYPQASQIGPSVPINTNLVHLRTTLSESRAIWNNLKVLSERSAHWPRTESDSHYSTARQTTANLVQMDLPPGSNGPPEMEKFIFYRGAGSFATPLHVSVDANETVVLKNTGSENLSSLFLVSVHKTGSGVYGSILSANNLTTEKPAMFPVIDRQEYPLEEFQTRIAAQMEAALVAEGLFVDEAKAMVNTWKDSWFTEEGERVLYILPRSWTDETLPLTLNPKPEKLVRVMVGRAEIITPKVERKLADSLTQAASGDAMARGRAVSDLKAFGRFAEPALRLATTRTGSTNVLALSHQLLSEVAQSKFE